MNRLQILRQHGQSVWYDDFQRSLIWTGALFRMVNEDDLAGLTTSPSSFERAMGDSTDYSPGLAALVAEGLDASDAYEHLAVEDMQWACDVLRPVYDATDGRDGFCCLEVSPHLTVDPIETADEASRLWELVGRENLMLKIPATSTAPTVVTELVSQGINVNVTLLFSLERYQEIHTAYLAGLEELVRAGGDPSAVASVAGFFVARIDALVDAQLDDRLGEAAEDARPKIEALKGQAGMAVARQAYRSYRETVESSRWKALAAEGARPQRLLWASTTPLDSSYRDVRYVEGLIGPDTVVALSPATYEAFRAHGEVAATLEGSVDETQAVLDGLSALHISMTEVTDLLAEEGLLVHLESFDRLMGALQGARTALMGSAQPTMELRLGAHETAVEQRCHSLDEQGFVRGLWGRDGTYFGEEDVAERAESSLGWLESVDVMHVFSDQLLQLQDCLETEQVESIVVLATGGTALAAEVFAQTFGQLDGSPELFVLDSTVPGQVRAIEHEVGLEETVFMVCAKSDADPGVRALVAYFAEHVRPTPRFVVVTDLDSPLAQSVGGGDAMMELATDPEVSEAFGALSPLAMAPAAAMGLDVDELLDRAQLMVASCTEAVPSADNPGVLLGATLAELARAGRDKLTLLLSSSIESFGPWIEQILVSATGKQGTGILPIHGETIAAPDRYGHDRVFAYIFVEDEDDEQQTMILNKLDALEAVGHPVLTFEVADPRDLTQEMFRWQVAAATAAYVLGVDPFALDETESVIESTSELLAGYASGGTIEAVPNLVRIANGDDLSVFADSTNAEAIGAASTVEDALRAHLGRLETGDYVAFDAFIEVSEASTAALQRIRHIVRDHHRVATSVSFGPRVLHTAGQFQKAGPNNGIIIQVTCDEDEAVPVPGHPYGLGIVKSAQENADFAALSAAGRRALRIHIEGSCAAGLETIARLLTYH